MFYSGTENFGVLISYFTRETGVQVDEVRKFLEIGDDYEDIC